MITELTSSLSVYLIDDDPDHTIIISRAIKKSGVDADIHAVADGSAALERLSQVAELPDLVLLDINMAGLTGFEVLSRLKSDPRLHTIPVVMLTSSELASDVARAYELGANGYITKPSELHDVRAVLGNTLLYWATLKRAGVAHEGQ